MQETSNIGNQVAAPSSVSAAAHCIVDSQSGRITAIDAQFAAWLDADPQQCNGRSLSDFAPELSRVEWSTVPQEGLSIQANLVSQERAERWVDMTLIPLIRQEEDCVLVTIQSAGTTSGIVYRDALTGLPDRRELARRRAQWQLNPPDKSSPYAVLFIDLDDFKKVNDAHGHAVGDKVLQKLAPRWQKCIRADDLIVRYGGDEFVALLAGIRQQKETEPIINRLVAATAEPITVGDLHLLVTVSIGVALAEDAAGNLKQLLHEADRDMYAAKGRDKD